MKKLIFALFMLIGTVTFASSNTTETTLLNNNAVEITETISNEVVSDLEIEITVTVTDYYVDGEYVGTTIEIEVTITF